MVRRRSLSSRYSETTTVSWMSERLQSMARLFEAAQIAGILMSDKVDRLSKASSEMKKFTGFLKGTVEQWRSRDQGEPIGEKDWGALNFEARRFTPYYPMLLQALEEMKKPENKKKKEGFERLHAFPAGAQIRAAKELLQALGVSVDSLAAAPGGLGA